jgi:hypothetical protein
MNELTKVPGATEGELLPREHLTLVLDREKLEALGFAQPPAAGCELYLGAVAVVVHSSTEDSDADGNIDRVKVVLRLTELVFDQPQAEDTRTAFERRDQSAARLYAKPHAPSGIAHLEAGVFNTRYGK